MHILSAEEQFRAQEKGHKIAAGAPIEEKFAKLMKLQELEFEIATIAGRPARKPWRVSFDDAEARNS